MYKIFSVAIFVIIANISLGQTTFKEKLEEAFSQDKVTAILNNSSKKQYYHNVIFSSYEVKEIDANKASVNPMPVLKIVTIVDRENKVTQENEDGNFILNLIDKGEFNILLTNVKRDFKNKTYYRIQGTNKILVVQSHQDISK